MFAKFFTQPKSRRVAVLLALLGTITPLAGLHKFYLGQPLWGIIYFLLRFSPLTNIDLILQSACAIEAVWYLVQKREEFEQRFQYEGGYFLRETRSPNPANTDTQQVNNIANTLRELERLRSDGLLSEYEFEQKRRQLVDRLV